MSLPPPPPLFYWKDAVHDYIAVLRYNAGEPVWLTEAESAKVLKVDESAFNQKPFRAHPSTKFPSA